MAELETGAAAEAVIIPALLKEDIEVVVQAIAKVAVGAEEVVGPREDVVASVDVDVDEDSRTIHRQRHPTQLLLLPTLNLPYFVDSIFPYVPPKIHLLVHLNGHLLVS